MPELLISEITRMADGFCVIGLMPTQAGFCSLRPMPRVGFAWRPFPYRRADRVAFELSLIPLAAPHLEDRQAANHTRLGAASEAELVDSLKRAEVAAAARELFGCNVRPNPRRGPGIYVDPEEGSRSICGCVIENISFAFNFYPQRNIRASVRLESGDRLDSLPWVDHDWLRFADHLGKVSQGTANVRQRLQTFFNRRIREHLLSSSAPFARIGLTRPGDDGRCWLMLDSVFPLPRKKWLEEFD